MRLFHRGNKKMHIWRGAVVGAAVALGITLLYVAGALDRVEWRLLDQRFVLRAIWQQPVDFGPVVVAAIDDETLRQVGRWPWGWADQARLVDAIAGAGAAVIGLDILYPEPDPDAMGVSRLVQSVHEAGNVVLAAGDDDGGRPWPELRAAAAGVGTIYFVPDRDGVVRRLNMNGTPGAKQPFAFELARAAGRPVGRDLVAGPFIINYRPQITEGQLRRYGMVPSVSAVDLLQTGTDADIRGKIVLVGLTARGAHDFHNTPLMTGTPGVYLHAFLLRSLLYSDPILPADGNVTMAALWLFTVLIAAGMFTVRPWLGAVVTVTAASVITLWAAGQFLRWGVWFALAPFLISAAAVFITGLIYAHQVVDKDERRIRRMFRRYVAPAVVDELLADDVATEAGRRATVTVLFADIRGFTSYAERVSPEEAMATLDAYLQVMGAAVLDHGGTLDKYIGDAVMAVFGAPVPMTDHAAVAWRTALDMQQRVQSLPSVSPDLRIGIGIHSGDVVVGSIGTVLRREYTAIGDVVNVASRLENVARADEIVYSEKTKRLLALDEDATEGVLEEVVIDGRDVNIAAYRHTVRTPGGDRPRT